MVDSFWFTVQTVYPDNRMSFHLGRSNDDGQTARSLCTGKPLDLAIANQGSPTTPQCWMCRHCLRKVG